VCIYELWAIGLPSLHNDWVVDLVMKVRFFKLEMEKITSLPFVMIDGGYGSASEDVFDFHAAILVGAGIGVTPFASILKTIWYRFNNSTSLKLKKV
jgi:NADPH oxidase 2